MTNNYAQFYSEHDLPYLIEIHGVLYVCRLSDNKESKVPATIYC